MAGSESPSISVSRRADSDVGRTVVWLRGDHDLTTKVTLAVAIARAARHDSTGVLVDLSMVTFMDASTIGAIVGSHTRLQVRGQVLQVRSPSRPARRVLELCGLTNLIHSGIDDEVHPSGAASALGSWVEVPSTTRNVCIDLDADNDDVAVHADAVLEVAEASATIEIDRGGP